MSVKALSAVFEESRARDSAFVVLLAMADWADHNGRCYPSYAQIATKARVSRATVIAAIGALVDLGELERVPHGQAPGDDDEAPAKVRSQWRNLYRIALLKPKAQVVQPLDHLETAANVDEVEQSLDYLNDDPIAQVVSPLDHLTGRSLALGSPTDTAQVVQPADRIKGIDRQVDRQDLKAGAPPLAPLPENPDDNLGVITKIAHEAIDLLGQKADLGDLAEAVKARCAKLQIIHWPGDVVRRAIDSARWQRTHRSAS